MGNCIVCGVELEPGWHFKHCGRRECSDVSAERDRRKSTKAELMPGELHAWLVASAADRDSPYESRMLMRAAAAVAELNGFKPMTQEELREHARASVSSNERTLKQDASEVSAAYMKWFNESGALRGNTWAAWSAAVDWARSQVETTDEHEPCVSHLALQEWERMFDAWMKHQAGLPSDVPLWPNPDWSQDVAMVAHALYAPLPVQAAAAAGAESTAGGSTQKAEASHCHCGLYDWDMRVDHIAATDGSLHYRDEWCSSEKTSADPHGDLPVEQS